jgi:hypothetical protein
MVLAAALATGPAAGASTTGHASYPTAQNLGPRFTTDGGASVLPTTKTVAHWNGSFVDGLSGRTYGYNMVGNPPSGGSTSVAAEIIPLDVSFAADGGAALGAEQAASWAAASPLFVPTVMPSGETAQYLDADMRSEFNRIGSGYHTVLAASVLPAATLTVPLNEGALYLADDGTVIGLVNDAWFAAHVQSLLASSHLDPTTLPIVLSNNVFLYQKSAATGCCTIGFHGAGHPPGMGAGAAHGNGDQPVQTFAWASWIGSAGIFGPGLGLTDVAALSHEVTEWGHDPFGTNFVNPWSAPGYGCTNMLETGDPLVGVDFGVGSNPDPATGPQWHLQDEAFLWWFAHTPTQASNGAYSYDGTFTSPAPTC